MFDHPVPLVVVLFYTCVCLLTACLIIGFFVTGGWVGVVLCLGIGIIWNFARKHKDTMFGHLALFLSVGLSGWICLSGGSTLISITAVIFSLAAWDLRSLDQHFEGITMDVQTRSFQKNHLKSLSMVLLISGVSILFGSKLNLDLPFIAVFILLIAAVITLNMTWHLLDK